MIPEDTLIYDIECATFGHGFKDLSKHVVRVVGAYSYKHKRYYILKDLRAVQKLIKEHKILVGFNNYFYDNPVLENHKINFDFKVIIDLKTAFKKRSKVISWNGFPADPQIDSYSLDFLSKFFELVDEDSGKGDLDYNVLNKKPFEWTPEEWADIVHYTNRDIEVTKKLFEFLIKLGEPYKQHVSYADQRKLKYATSPSSSYGYKVLMLRSNMEEEYSNSFQKTGDEKDDGGYVSYPAGAKFVADKNGKIYCLDWASLYPHLIASINSFGRVQDPTAWHGGVWKIDGYYDTQKVDVRTQAVYDIYTQRKAMKDAGDPNEYGLKIAINSCYGIMGNAVFKNVYDPVARNDICLLGQQIIKYTRKVFADNGYKVIYTDTDSVYIKDVFNDKDKIAKIKDEIASFVQNSLPFPRETFILDFDYTIEMIHFFKGKDEASNAGDLDEEDLKNKKLGLMKKNYMFVYYDKKGNKKVYVKNLGVVKRDKTKLMKKVFWEKIAPSVLESGIAQFPQWQLEQWVKEYLSKDTSLMLKRFNVKPYNQYSSKSNCMQKQIAAYVPPGKKEPLGDGVYFMYPNTKMGVGKGKRKYCLPEQFENHLSINDLDLSVVLDELVYFNSDAGHKFTAGSGQRGLSWFG